MLAKKEADRVRNSPLPHVSAAAVGDTPGVGDQEMISGHRKYGSAEGELGYLTARPKPNRNVRRVAFCVRFKEPIYHHRRGPTELMFSRDCEVSAMWHRGLGSKQEKERGFFSQ
ncbi:unnamed protein product [Spodoptera exigua]|nr:unnamed protein product [Spodoptera exigua]